MGEYTAQCAARDTRRAIEGVRKAMTHLQQAAVHWGDLDSMFESLCAGMPDLPNEVDMLERDLDEIYPRRARRRAAR